MPAMDRWTGPSGQRKFSEYNAYQDRSDWTDLESTVLAKR